MVDVSIPCLQCLQAFSSGTMGNLPASILALVSEGYGELYWTRNNRVLRASSEQYSVSEFLLARLCCSLQVGVPEPIPLLSSHHHIRICRFLPSRINARFGGTTLLDNPGFVISIVQD